MISLPRRKRIKMSISLNNLVIPVNKSEGLSTYDVIRRFKKSSGSLKVGHSGTLDPAATGLVLLLTGMATKLSSYLMDLPKRYVAEVTLGKATDTQDADGKVLRTEKVGQISREQVESVLKEFVGRRKQVPPMYSALKHEGTPLYRYARQGRVIERPPREVDIYEMEMKEFDLPAFTVEVSCSRGMYVRTLAEEIGEALSVPSHLSGLVRTEIGHFNIGSSVSDDSFGEIGKIAGSGYSLSDALQHLPEVRLTRLQEKNLENGIPPVIGTGLPAEGHLLRLVRGNGILGAIAKAGPSGSIILRKVFPVDRSE